MCGKFALVSDWSNIAGAFGLAATDQFFAPRGDIYPASDAACIIRRGTKNFGTVMQWGFSPVWGKQKVRKSLLINARAETLSRKPAFRDAFPKRRCLIVADGFYEWSKEKTQFYFCLRNHQPFGLAGLYEEVSMSGSAKASFVIITTVPNELIAPVHDRMPVIISEGKQSLWLDNSKYDINELVPLFNPYPASEMAIRPAEFPAKGV
ncbi:MAG: putative SOS response-associated peptidase YedK [Smithella sp. PtaU1.Bin162]|nr:MAG: putative SOS response-associated peptidase YedK [Smithella sp. PtaU1.Bin162]